MMTNKLTWFDKHSAASMILFDIAIELETLARGFQITGNTNMYESLMAIKKELEGAAREINDAIGESLAESIGRSAKSSENVLKAALAGILIAGKNR
jgi:hypothetical protein